jgi:hypothetical protein
MKRRDFFKGAAGVAIGMSVPETVVAVSHAPFTSWSPVRHLFVYSGTNFVYNSCPKNFGIASIPFDAFWENDVLKCLEVLSAASKDFDLSNRHTNATSLKEIPFITSHRVISEEQYKEVMNKVSVRIEWSEFDSLLSKYPPLKVIPLSLVGNDQEPIYVEV